MADENQEGEASGSESTVRRSKRIADKPAQSWAKKKRREYGPLEWKEAEKKIVLDFVKQNGSKNWRDLVELLPSKSFEQIRFFVTRERRNHTYVLQNKFHHETGEVDDVDTSKKQKKSTHKDGDGPDALLDGKFKSEPQRIERDAPIEDWIKLMEKKKKAEENVDHIHRANWQGLQLPLALNLIADTEDHPDPEECGGVDYAQIYRALADLADGEVPADLNQPTAARLSLLISEFCSNFLVTKMQEEKRALKAYRPAKKLGHIEVESVNTEEDAVRQLCNLTDSNPLRQHPNLFINQKVEKFDSLSFLHEKAAGAFDQGNDEPSDEDAEGIDHEPVKRGYVNHQPVEDEEPVAGPSGTQTIIVMDSDDEICILEEGYEHARLEVREEQEGAANPSTMETNDVQDYDIQFYVIGDQHNCN